MVFHFAGWLANFSKVNLKHKTGLSDPHANQTSLLQTQRITETMRERSLPSFLGYYENCLFCWALACHYRLLVDAVCVLRLCDSRRHRAACSEIIGRIHNQGPVLRASVAQEEHVAVTLDFEFSMRGGIPTNCCVCDSLQLSANFRPEVTGEVSSAWNQSAV